MKMRSRLTPNHQVTGVDQDSDVNAFRVQADVTSARRVNIIQSAYLDLSYGKNLFRVTLDGGATSNMVLASFATKHNLPVTPASQVARQADGVTKMDVIGETHFVMTHKHQHFTMDALVVKQLDVDILAGNPFMALHDIYARPSRSMVLIGDSECIPYDPTNNRSLSSIRRTQAYVLRSSARQTVLFPGESLELQTPSDISYFKEFALEPRLDSTVNKSCDIEQAWPQPQEIAATGGTISIPNNTDRPIILWKDEHFCQLRTIVCPDPDPVYEQQTAVRDIQASTPYCSPVQVDPNHILPLDFRRKFADLHLQYDSVFNPSIPKYNGASGNISAVVNMGPTLPPQRKGRLPQYNRSSMDELQAKFDYLETQGVFAKPEDAGVVVEYLNPSFLIKKPNGGSRLVTSFGEVARYSKPQPSLMPDVESVLRQMAKWKFLIVIDLSSSFYQIPLSKESMKFCGVATPYKGL